LALLWAVALTAVGTFVLWNFSTEAWQQGLGWCISASFDEVLPLVEYNKAHAEFIEKKLTGWRQVYFYGHRTLGYFIGLFVAAGVAGLTQGSR
jgi:hypothetical protein